MNREYRSTRGARGRFVCAAVASTVFLWLTPSPAHADAPDAPEVAEPVSAEELAEHAYQLHAEGKYAEAIATYLKAYGISSAGAILFNVAVIYDRKLGERELAAEYYRRYLSATDVDPDLARKATERLTSLKRDAEAAERARRASPALPAVSAAPDAPTGTASVTRPPEPAAASTVAVAPSPVRSGGGLRTSGIIFGATGVAGIGASLVLGLLAKGKNDDANAMCNGAACTSERGVELGQQAGTLATASTVVFAAGLACLGGGVAMFLAAPPSSTQPPQLAFLPQVGQAGAAMNVRVGF